MAIQIHEKKYNRQLIAIDRWKRAKELGSSHTNCWGTFWWQTGVGKTFGACIIINKILNHNSGNNIVIMVPGPELKKQWISEIKSNVKEEWQAHIRVYTVGEVQSIMSDNQRISCSLFIADELHEYYTDERLKIFNGSNVVTKWMLGLTADYQDKNNRYRNIQEILPVVDRIDEEEALREGYISQYIEYNLSVDLTSDELEKYRNSSDIISKNLSKFGHGGIELAGKVLQGDKSGTGMEYAIKYASQHGWRRGMSLANPNDAQIMQVWSPNMIFAYAKLAMENIRERKNLLYYSKNKLKVAVDVVKKFENLKTICFSQSTLFADTLAKVIKAHYESCQQTRVCVVYHSQLDTIITHDSVTGKQKKKGKTILKREAIETFSKSSNGIMSTASSLDKGLNVEDIALGLTTSGTQNPTQYNQRGGRTKRKNGDMIVLIINMYVRNTMDEIWLKNRQKKSNNIVYWVDNIDDINYSPRNNRIINDIEV
jgi:superfamily II DNA or RNA helicase